MASARHKLSAGEVERMLRERAEQLAKLPVTSLYEVMKNMTDQEIKSVCTVNKELAAKCRESPVKELIDADKEWRNIVKELDRMYTHSSGEDLSDTLLGMLDVLDLTMSDVDLIAKLSKMTRKQLISKIKRKTKRTLSKSTYEQFDDHALVGMLMVISKEYDDESRYSVEEALIRLPREKRREWIKSWNKREKDLRYQNDDLIFDDVFTEILKRAKFGPLPTKKMQELYDELKTHKGYSSTMKKNDLLRWAVDTFTNEEKERWVRIYYKWSDDEENENENDDESDEDEPPPPDTYTQHNQKKIRRRFRTILADLFDLEDQEYEIPPAMRKLQHSAIKRFDAIPKQQRLALYDDNWMEWAGTTFTDTEAKKWITAWDKIKE